jgi:hypothetical protein
MATTGARFSEIAQFSLNSTDPSDGDTKWDFIVKIKNREFLQPIVIHRMQHPEIDAIAAMKELRMRIRKKRKKTYR